MITTIIATEVKNFKMDIIVVKLNGKATLLHFKLNKISKNGLIGLVPGDNTVINNIFFVSGIKSKITGPNKLSVTVIDYKSFSNRDLIDRVKYELKKYCGINVIRLISQFNIPKSLPDLKDISYAKTPSEFQISDCIFLAGDHQIKFIYNAAITYQLLCLIYN